MVNPSASNGDSIRQGDSAALHLAQAELLQVVLSDNAYPWLADEPAASSYEMQLEAAGQLLEVSEAEAAEGWQKLSGQLSGQLSEQLPELWSNAGVTAQLGQKFAGRLPADIIARIGERARQMVSSGEAATQSVLEQMMACVQDVLSHVADDDLRVMARPMAVAMRGDSAEDFIEANIRSVRRADWAALSPIEQAKLGLAAARYAISEAEAQR